MMRIWVSIATVGFLCFGWTSQAKAQSACSYIVNGAVLTAAQWNLCFQLKQDLLGFTPVNKAGDVMLGVLGTIASTGLAAGFNISPGIAPTSPNNGDVWTTSAGLFVRINGSTVGPLVAAGGTVTSVTCGTGLSGGTFTTSGTCAINLPTATNALSGDVSLSNTSNYFDGPSMAQGTSGTWFASGTVTLIDTAGTAQIYCKLWDGTTVLASTDVTVPTASYIYSISLSGYIVSPAANIRISCKDNNSTSGKILFNTTSLSKDSTIWGIRIN